MPPLLTGILLGAVLTIAGQLYLIYRFFVRPYLRPAQAAVPGASASAFPKSKSTAVTAEWPPNIVRFLQRANYPTPPPAAAAESETEPSSSAGAADDGNADGGESAAFDRIDPALLWFNAALHRYFVECRRSAVVTARLRQKLKEKLARRFGTASASGGDAGTTAASTASTTAASLVVRNFASAFFIGIF